MVTTLPTAGSFAGVDFALNTFAFLPVNEPSATGSDLAVWVERTRAGDEAAARHLLARLHPLVVKIVRAHLPWRSSPEDLVQMVFIKVFTRLGQYGGEVPLEHWVARIAVNTCISQIKAQRSRPEWRWADLSAEQAGMLERQETADDAGSVARNLAARETVALLLDGLPPADRLLITLHYLEHQSIGEMSLATGWGAVTIRVRLMRARRKMGKLLRALREEDRP